VKNNPKKLNPRTLFLFIQGKGTEGIDAALRIDAKAGVSLSPRRVRMIAISSKEKKKEGTDFLELEDFTIE